MAAVEMESFSDAQLLAITVLMLMGGEVFTSMLDFWFLSDRPRPKRCAVVGDGGSSEVDFSANQLELGPTTTTSGAMTTSGNIRCENDDDADESMARYLGRTVLGCFVTIQLAGFMSLLTYLKAVPSAGDILRGKHIRLTTFSLFTVVSTFGNCGFIPNNEGMVAFKNNSGLLIILCLLVVAGNTLFPPLLRLLLSLLHRHSGRHPSESPAFFLLEPHRASYYPSLLSSQRCRWLVVTVVGFAAVQMALLCGMEWSKETGLGGVRGTYRKLVAALFMSLSSRHSGESVVDMSAVAPAILALYVVMMYLPGYTYFLPSSSDVKQDSEITTVYKEGGIKKNQVRHELPSGRSLWQDLLLSHISYLTLFTILICITESRSISADPLNFSVLNVAFEVVSAYGNVGFTTGYSCQRRLTTDASCSSPSYGFVGAWSTQGKLILVAVMFLGKLKRLTAGPGGGRAWKIV